MTTWGDYVPFYHPGYDTPWDKEYGSGYLGNFFKTPVRLTSKGRRPGREFVFQTAEAAFQATKFWDNEQAVQELQKAADGDAAFRIKARLESVADRSYGYGKSSSGSDPAYDAMLDVLWSKFEDEELADKLLATGDAFLLEHNVVSGRDKKWSDNHDGSGANALGEALMATRARLRGDQWWQRRPSGLPDWQVRVRAFADRTRDQFERSMSPGSQPPAADRTAQARKRKRSTSPGAASKLCLEGAACYKAMGVGGRWRPAASWNGRSGQHCSRSCKEWHTAFGSGVPPCVEGQACLKAREQVDGAWWPQPAFKHSPGENCSMSCRKWHAAFGFGVAPCVRGPGCVRAAQADRGAAPWPKPSFNGAPGEYCSRDCQKGSRGP